MATVAVEQFTDPFSPWCWAAQPTLRRLRYEFEDVAWTPRMTVLLPGAIDDAEDDRRTAWVEAATATGMPVADELWPAGLPDSRPACAAVAFVRAATPARALPVLRRLRVAAFAEGRAMDAPADLAAVAGQVDGVEGEAVRRALADGRAADALEADLARAVEVAEERATAEVRGDLSLLPAVGRVTGDPEEPAADDPGVDEETEAAEADPVLLGPPALRVERGSTLTLCDAGLPYGRLATALGRSAPTTGVQVDDKFAISRMAMHVPREVAESLSAQDFVAEVAPYLRRFGRAYLPEVVAATGRSPETCAEALARLVDRGDAERLGPREWRTVDDPGPRGRGT